MAASIAPVLWRYKVNLKGGAIENVDASSCSVTPAGALQFNRLFPLVSKSKEVIWRVLAPGEWTQIILVKLVDAAEVADL